MGSRTLSMRTPRLKGLFGLFIFMVFFMFVGTFASAQSSPQTNPLPFSAHAGFPRSPNSTIMIFSK